MKYIFLFLSFLCACTPIATEKKAVINGYFYRSKFCMVYHMDEFTVWEKSCPVITFPDSNWLATHDKKLLSDTNIICIKYRYRNSYNNTDTTCFQNNSLPFVINDWKAIEYLGSGRGTTRLGSKYTEDYIISATINGVKYSKLLFMNSIDYVNATKKWHIIEAYIKMPEDTPVNIDPQLPREFDLYSALQSSRYSLPFKSRNIYEIRQYRSRIKNL